ncbi:hypothetical protein ACSBR2_042018 [Camellia fascicularis]
MATSFAGVTGYYFIVSFILSLSFTHIFLISFCVRIKICNVSTSQHHHHHHHHHHYEVTILPDTIFDNSLRAYLFEWTG